jgi:hypothetical protein
MHGRPHGSEDALIDRVSSLCYSVTEMLTAGTARAGNRDTTVCLVRTVLKAAFVLAVLSQSCSLDHGLEPSVQGISGTIRFHGAWPDTILEVRVAVFADYPVESFVDLSGYSDPAPLLSDSAAYGVQLAPGTYDFIAVAGRTTETWNTGCVLGFYHTETDPETPKAIHLESGEHLEGIDMTVDFGPSGAAATAEAHSNRDASPGEKSTRGPK